MHPKLVSLFFVIILLGSACAPQAGENHLTPVAPTARPQPRTLTVLAAASLTDSFKELGQRFESQNPGVRLSFSFAGSQQLAQQIDQGAPADVFASASKKYMDAAIASMRVADGTPTTFAQNRLVVIFPKDNPAGLSTLQDLAKPGLKLDFADISVPVGQYTLDFLDKAAQEAALGADFKEKVLSNVVSYEMDVKAVVSKISLGEVDAGVVYFSDYHTAAGTLGRLDIPDALNVISSYPIAPIADGKNADLAEDFIGWVLSPEGQAILSRHGFVPVTP